MARRPPDEALLRRALLLSKVPGVRVAEVCARFGLSAAALRRAKRELPPVTPTDEDLVQMALSRASRPLREDEIIGYVDWVNHAVWAEAELAALLARLEAAGRVRRAGGGWELAAEWP